MRNQPPGVPVPRADWSVVAHRRGLPWWGAVLVAVGFTVLGAAIDLLVGTTLTTIFQLFYGLGCVVAVLAVAQRALFAPMVQPPLVLAVAVPSVVLLLGGPTDGSTRGRVIAAAIPLVNGFPTMAVATLVTIALGVVRIRLRRVARPAHAGRSSAPPSSAGARRAARPAGARAGSAAAAVAGESRAVPGESPTGPREAGVPRPSGRSARDTSSTGRARPPALERGTDPADGVRASRSTPDPVREQERRAPRREPERRDPRREQQREERPRGDTRRTRPPGEDAERDPRPRRERSRDAGPAWDPLPRPRPTGRDAEPRPSWREPARDEAPRARDDRPPTPGPRYR